MKLNIYEKRKVVKTYETDVYDLMFGTLEDVAAAVKIDELKTGDDIEIIKLVGRLVASSMGTVKELLKDIFQGISDDEIRNTKVSEIVTVLMDVVKAAVAQIGTLPRAKN